MKSLLRHVRSLHSLAPANKDHVSAWRVAISVAVPSLALLAAGRPELIGLRRVRRADRHVRPDRAAPAPAPPPGPGGLSCWSPAWQSASSSRSTTSIRGRWWSSKPLLAGVGSLFADKVEPETQRPVLRHPGPGRVRLRSHRRPLARGRCSSPRDRPRSPSWSALAAGSAAGPGSAARRRDVTVAARGTGAGRPWLHAARYVAAVGGAGTIGVLSGSGHPHWAMAAAAVPLAGADLPSSVYRGIHRIVGTLLGLVVVAVGAVPVAGVTAAGLPRAMRPPSWPSW